MTIDQRRNPLVSPWLSSAVPPTTLAAVPVDPALLPNAQIALSSDGVTLTGGAVSAITNMLTPAHSLTDGGNASQRPALITSVAAANGKPCVRSNGTTNFLQSVQASFILPTAINTYVLVFGNSADFVTGQFYFDAAGISGNKCALSTGGVRAAADGAGGNQCTVSMFDTAYRAPNSAAVLATAPGATPVHVAVIKTYGTTCSISIDGGHTTTGPFTHTLDDGMTLFSAQNSAAAGFPKAFDFYAFRAIAGRVISAGEEASAVAWAQQTYRANRVARRLLLVQGDSIAAGTSSGGTILQAWPIVAAGGLSASWYPQNVAQGGYTAQTAVGQVASIDELFIDAAWDQNINIFALGRNDIAAGRTRQQLETDLTALIAACRATAATAGLPYTAIVGTVIADGSSAGITYDSVRLAVNADLRTPSVVGADYVLDFAADPAFGPIEAASDLTYYTVGKLHPNVAGEARMGAIALARLQSLGIA